MQNKHLTDRCVGNILHINHRKLIEVTFNYGNRNIKILQENFTQNTFQNPYTVLEYTSFKFQIMFVNMDSIARIGS